MAYLPPLNGGRINATISGNTAGAGSLVSSGTLILAGGNNITLSQAGNAITISGANQSNQSLSMYAVGNTTQNSSSAIDARSISFNGLGGLTAGYSNGSIQLSAPGVSSLSATGALSISNNGNTVSIGVPAVSFGMSNIGNTSGTSGTVSNQLVFAGGNNITLSQATGAGGNTLSISAGAASVNFSAGTTSANLAAVTFANGNGVSFGLNGSTITASHNALTSQSAQTQNVIQAVIAGTGTASSGTISFASSNGISFGLNGQTLTASHNAITSQTVQTQNIYNLVVSGGNSTSAGAGFTPISSGTLTIAGGNNITLSQNGNAITISGGAGGGGIALANSQTTYSTGTAKLLEGGGAITIASTTGQGFNISVPAQSNLSATGIVSISSNGNTISIGAPAFSVGIASNSTVSNQLILTAGNNITLGQATNATGATITISAGANAFSAGMSTGGNTTGTAGLASNQLVLAGGNNITLSQNTNSAGATVTVSAAAASVNISAGTASNNLSAVTFSNSNNVSFGLNGSVLTGSVGAPLDVGVYSAAGGTTYGSTGANTNGLAFYAGSNIGLSQATDSNGASVTIIGPAAGGGGGGIALANSNSTITSGIANLSVVGGALTISGTSQSFNFSVPQTSSIVGTGGLSVSTTGSTISMGFPAPVTLSRWEYPTGAFGTIGTQANNQLSLQHVYIPYNVTGSAGKIGVSISAGSFSSATTASVNYSLSMGIYTLNGSTLSLLTASSGTANNGFTWLNTASSSQYVSSINGVRQMTVPMAINITPGEYWVGALLNSASTFSGSTLSMMGNSLIGGTGVLGIIGSLTASGRDAFLGQGMYATAALPINIALSAINNTSVSFAERAAFYHALFNATY